MLSRGIQRERDLKHQLEANDWVVVRAAGSLGAVDLIALKIGCTPKLIEVKSTSRGPYHSFSPAERADLSQRAAWAGAEAWLVWWPPRSEPVWIPESSWPRRLEVAS